ncbi:AAA-ATPase At2g46620-like [Phoenix dactylifera]|uniref:AAA-ATPase At2g46620-like n=1 Tax=Phoenix dactylifera TaxID=42345 RepID=A0A8B7C2W7_PHODC|nr:AAA-ATPase At2g46620-like [Phoenix dactylifera]
MIIPANPFSVVLAAVCGLAILRTILSARALLYHLGRWWRWVDERVQAYQYFEIPRYNENSQENPLYRKVANYVASLPSLEDAAAATLFSSGRKPNDFLLHLGPGQSASDSFLGARVTWSNRPPGGATAAGGGCLVLRVRRQDRTRVLRPYLQHVESVAEDIEIRRREVRLFTYAGGSGEGPRWRSVPFTHPSTLDTVAMDPDLKTRVRADLEAFLKGRAYYHRLGRVWRRSYLLYGPPGTGKSTFVAAMAKFLSYDIYDVDLSGLAADGAVLRSLLLQTTPRSVILVEDLDRYLNGKESESSAARLTEMLSFMDGVFSCCGEERVMVFTMSGGEGAKEGLDPAVLRPGRLDVHIHFPMCDFSAFKTLASSYLGLKDHKLYPQVEEGFQNGAQLSPAVVSEIMIANRGSPTRAIKSVISALQQSADGGRVGAAAARKLSESGSGRRTDESRGEWSSGGGLGFGKDSMTMREFRKLYGFIKMRSGSKKEGVMPVEEAAAAAAAAAAATPSDKD